MSRSIIENLGYIFDRSLHLTPSRAALLQDDTVISFEVLNGRCNRIANALKEMGLKQGERVALMFNNDYRFLESLFGAMRFGAVPIPLNIKMGDEALSFVLADAETKLLIASRKMAERAKKIATGVKSLRRVIIDDDEAPGHISYEQLLGAQSDQFPRRTSNPDEICMQPYTSGSTGKPKGVLLTHSGQLWNADAFSKSLHVDDRERALVCVPLFHKNAMACAVKPFLIGGGSIVILPEFNPLEVIRAIEKYQVTYMTGVPSIYKLILNEKELLERHNVSSLSYAICSSAEVPEELLDEFINVFDAPIAEVYGLTEGGALPLMNTRWGFKKRGSCGRAFPGCEVRVVADDGKTEVPDDIVGELITRNPGVAKAYWNRPDATEEKIREGWLYTGDLFRRDQEGFYYFVGRKDDLINVGGENVYPKEVEDILLTHPDLRDVCVVSMQHEIKGEVPVAFVVKKEAADITEDEVKQYFLDKGAAYAHPRKVVFLNELPLGGTGKLDRSSLKNIANR